MSHLAVTQNSPADTTHTELAPHEYYNKHVRKEGQPVLDEAQYNIYLQQKLRTKNKISLAQAELLFNKMKNDATSG